MKNSARLCQRIKKLRKRYRAQERELEIIPYGKQNLKIMTNSKNCLVGMKTIKNQNYNQLLKNKNIYQIIISNFFSNFLIQTAIKALKAIPKFKAQEQVETNQKHIVLTHKKCSYFH